MNITPEIEAVIDRVHASPYQGVIAVTGCSSSIVDLLLARGGGSKTLLDARVPYSTGALTQFIGHTPQKFCSNEVAKELASSAYSRATSLKEQEVTPVFGLGITATLRKKGPEREGRIHQVFISFQTHRFTYSHHVILNPQKDREQQDFYVGLLALDVLAQHLCGERIPGGRDSFTKEERIEKLQHPEKLQKLLAGELSFEDRYFTNLYELDRENQILIPGSFNPFHDGHQRMGDFAARSKGKAPLYEISLSNVDKGKLSGFEIQKRLEALTKAGILNVVITDCPTFVEKAKLFPGSTFVIGVDTWYRLIDPKYHGHSQEQCEVALNQIREMGCDFLVLGRFVNGHYHTLPTDETTKGLAQGVSEADFRVDISSTQLRV